MNTFRLEYRKANTKEIKVAFVEAENQGDAVCVLKETMERKKGIPGEQFIVSKVHATAFTPGKVVG